MDFLMSIWSFFATNILTQPAYFIGLMVLVGYLLLKKPLYEAFAGFIKATVGYMILAVGSGGLVNNFRPILVGLKDRFNLDAMVIDPYFGQNAVTAPFIRRLPQGYDTPLHSDGANLSQGQRQLLAIARAAISRPPVLILDEATSSIDTRTEKLIEKGMDALMDGRTVFVIAHRLSTVRNSKAIMVLEKGEIIERGSHEELIDQRGRYYKLYTGQFELE